MEVRELLENTALIASTQDLLEHPRFKGRGLLDVLFGRPAKMYNFLEYIEHSEVSLKMNARIINELYRETIFYNGSRRFSDAVIRSAQICAFFDVVKKLHNDEAYRWEYSPIVMRSICDEFDSIATRLGLSLDLSYLGDSSASGGTLFEIFERYLNQVAERDDVERSDWLVSLPEEENEEENVVKSLIEQQHPEDSQLEAISLPKAEVENDEDWRFRNDELQSRRAGRKEVLWKQRKKYFNLSEDLSDFFVHELERRDIRNLLTANASYSAADEFIRNFIGAAKFFCEDYNMSKIINALIEAIEVSSSKNINEEMLGLVYEKMIRMSFGEPLGKESLDDKYEELCVDGAASKNEEAFIRAMENVRQAQLQEVPSLSIKPQNSQRSRMVHFLDNGSSTGTDL